MLPLEIELLVAPRHVHMARHEVGAVLAYLRDMQREPAAQRLRDRALELLLRLARLRPVTLDHLMPMLDLDERASRVIARAPHRREFFARFQRPLRSRDELRNLQRELRVRRTQHRQRQTRRHRFAETILRLQHRSIRSRSGRELQLRVALGIRGEALLSYDLAEFPIVWVRQVGIRFAIAILVAAIISAQARALNFRRLLEPMNLHLAFGGLRFAIQRRRANRQRHRLVRRLPLTCGKRGGERGEADVHGTLRGTRFARRVGDIRRNAEAKRRLVLLGNAGVRLRVELDVEDAVRSGARRAVGDFLAALRAGRTPAIPAPPMRPAHFAHDAILHLRAIDRRAGVALGLARERHLVVQLRRRLRRVERHLELRPLVFLHVERRLARWPIEGSNCHAAHQAIPRCGEAAAEGTVVIAELFNLRDLLPIRIAEHDCDILAGKHFIIVAALIHAQADALVLNRLAGPVKRAVGEEDGLVMRVRFVNRIAVVLLHRTQLMLCVANLRAHAEEAAAIFLGRKREKPVRVGADGRCGRHTIAKVIEMPRHHLRTGDRFARVRFEHEAFDALIVRTNDEREFAHPDVRAGHLILAFGELLIVACDDEIETGFERHGRRNEFSALLEINGGRQSGGPFERRCPGQQLAALGVVQVLWTTMALVEERIPIPRHGAEIDIGHVAITDSDVRPRCIPHALGADACGLRLDLRDEIPAHLPADAVAMGVRAAQRQRARLHEIALALNDPRPMMQRERGERVVGPFVGEGLERGLVTGRLVLAERGVVSPDEAGEISVGEGGGILVVAMENQEVTKQEQRLLRCGLVRSPLNLASDELLRSAEYGHEAIDWFVREQLEGVLGFGGGLFAARVELQRLLRDEVVERRAIAVRHGSLLQQVIKRRDGRLLQRVRAGERLGELPVDLGEETRQIPRREILAGRLGRGGALHETPAVVLEVMPVPVRRDGIKQRHNLLRRLGDLGLHARDLFLGLVPLDVAFEHDLPRDGLGDLAVSLVLERGGNDEVEVGDGRARQSFLDSFLDRLPLGVARGGVERDVQGDEKGECREKSLKQCIHGHPWPRLEQSMELMA